MNMDWRGGAQVGKLYMIQSDDDFSRVGNCAMSGRLRKGDILVAIRHSGDCFYDYQLVKVYANAVTVEDIKLGAYTLGKPTKWQIPANEVQAFLAGESICTKEVWDELLKFLERDSSLALEAVKAAKKGQVVRFKHRFDHHGRSPFATIKENCITTNGGELVVSSLTENGKLEDLTIPFKELSKLEIAF